MGRPPLCPDCGLPLEKRSVSGRYFCDNPECPVIYVVQVKGGRQGTYTRITRSALAR